MLCNPKLAFALQRASRTCRAAGWSGIRGVVLFSIVRFAPPLSAAETVHTADFESGRVPPEWSVSQTEGFEDDEKFLGEFGNQHAKLRLAELPKHEFIRIKCDLLIIRDWDGSSSQAEENGQPRGPDFWNLQVSGGPRLIRATFHTVDYSENGLRQQSFPELDERLLTAAETGAIKKPQPQGEQQFRRPGPQNPFFDNDSSPYKTYRLNLVFPHQADELEFDFFGELHPGYEEESWALDNVTVETLSAKELPPLAAERVIKLWKALGQPATVPAAEACWELIAHPEQAVALVKEHQSELTARDLAQERRNAAIKTLVGQLGSDTFADREAAFRELQVLGPTALAAARQELRAAHAAEIREKLRFLINDWSNRGQPRLREVELRRLRLARVMEIVNNPAAVELLKALKVE